MSSEEFVVRIADLDAGPQRLQMPVSRQWLARALSDTEGAPWDRDDEAPNGSVDLEIARSGRQILVRGTIQARVTLPCARTLDPAHYGLESKVFLLLSPAPEESAAARHDPGQRRRHHKSGRSRAVPDQLDKGISKTAPAASKSKRGGGDWSEDPELTEETAATDTYSGEVLLLDEFIREFIVLEFPMFPLREDLRSDTARASCALPSGAEAPQPDEDRPLDPRLSPLAELKARLEKKARLETKE